MSRIFIWLVVAGFWADLDFFVIFLSNLDFAIGFDVI